MRKKWLLVLLMLVWLVPSLASAQWVFVARKAMGLISHVVDQTHTHETASVLLEADANKVYAAAVRILHEKPDVQVLSRDDGDRTLSFRHGTQAVTLKVAYVQEDLSQILVVASGGDPGQEETYVVRGILRICQEVGVHCSPGQE